MNGTASTSGQIGTNANGFTLTNQSTIQGSGLIGSNAGPVYQNLSLNNSGTIDGNAAVSALVIGGDGSSIINSGTFEATGGGTLTLQPTAAINNAGGFITANAGTVNVGATIQGGTLTTSNGGVMQTTAAGATLDASSQGAITLANESIYTSTAGTTNITGTLNLGTSTGSTLTLGGALELTGDTMLTGPGGSVVNISGNATNSTGGQIGTNANGYMLTNNVTIQGTGVISSNNTTYQNLSLINNGTINADTGGQALTIGGTGTITNAGLFEATGGGVLNLSTSAAIGNSGANITANAGTVNVSTKIVGGTLTTSNGGVMQTTAAGATLDAASNGAILLSDGSIYTSTCHCRPYQNHRHAEPGDFHRKYANAGRPIATGGRHNLLRAWRSQYNRRPFRADWRADRHKWQWLHADQFDSHPGIGIYWIKRRRSLSRLESYQ